MLATLEPTVQTMGRKPKPDKPPANDITVKIDRDLQRDIRTLAGFHGSDTGPWLTQFLRPLIAQEMDRMAKQIQARSESHRHKS